MNCINRAVRVKYGMLTATTITGMLAGLCFLFAFLAGHTGSLICGVILTLITGAMGTSCYLLHQYVEASYQEERSLSYVPPVTLNTLPAEEVLVRASQEPIQEQSNVLLRAAIERQETAGKELLRPTGSQETRYNREDAWSALTN